MDLGTQLSSGVIESGLRELNPDISFDAPGNRPSDYAFALQTHRLLVAEKQRKERSGIYYQGRYIGPMDRGLIPEHRVWSSKEGCEEIPIGDIMRYDDTKVAYKEIPPTDPNYNEALLRVERFDDNFTRTKDGKIFYYQALRFGKVRDAIVRNGWRATFERLISERIPGVTRRALAAKFGVDLTPREMQEIMLGDEYTGHKVEVAGAAHGTDTS